MSIQRGWEGSSQASEEPLWNPCFFVKLPCLSHPFCSLLLSDPPALLISEVSVQSECSTGLCTVHIFLISFTSPGHMLVPPKSASPWETTWSWERKSPHQGDPPLGWSSLSATSKRKHNPSKIKERHTGACNQQHKDLELASGMTKFRGSNDVSLGLCPFFPFVVSTFF